MITDKKKLEDMAIKIENCLEKGDIYLATIYALEEGHVERAMEIYEKAGWFSSAAHLAKESGLVKKAQELIDRQIERDEMSGNFGNAAIVAELWGRSKKSKELYAKCSKIYEEAGNFLFAGLDAKSAGLDERAQKMYSKYEDYCAKEAGPPLNEFPLWFGFFSW